MTHPAGRRLVGQGHVRIVAHLFPNGESGLERLFEKQSRPQQELLSPSGERGAPKARVRDSGGTRTQNTCQAMSRLPSMAAAALAPARSAVCGLRHVGNFPTSCLTRVVAAVDGHALQRVRGRPMAPLLREHMKSRCCRRLDWRGGFPARPSRDSPRRQTPERVSLRGSTQTMGVVGLGLRPKPPRRMSRGFDFAFPSLAVSSKLKA